MKTCSTLSVHWSLKEKHHKIIIVISNVRTPKQPPLTSVPQCLYVPILYTYLLCMPVSLNTMHTKCDKLKMK